MSVGLSYGQHRRSNSERGIRASHARTRPDLGASRDGADFVANDDQVGALGLLIYQAAKEGSVVGLRFALSRKGGEWYV